MFNERGLTLVEIIAVLLIMAVLVSIAFFKFVGLGSSADNRVIETTVAGFNSTENLTWSNMRIGGEYIDDPDLFSKVSFDMGDCVWMSFSISGGRIKCGKAESDLIRTPSTKLSPGTWR